VAPGNGQSLEWLTSLATAIRTVHETAVRTGGGIEGEFAGRLEAACARPFQAVFGEALYPTPVLKAAALFDGIITGHPFADGNKRTASLAAITLLAASGFLAARPSSLQVRLIGEVAVETALPASLHVGEVADWFERILGLRPQA
jgi:prophage maintenance system killer protein